MKHIALFIDTRAVGGIESHVLNLAVSLKRQGLSPRVLLWSDYQGGAHPMVRALIENQVSVVDLAGSLQALRQQLCDVSLVHTHGYKASLLTRLTNLSVGTPHVTTFHAGERCRGRLALYDWADRFSARMSQGRIAVSQAIADRVAAGCRVINNFVNPSQQPAPVASQAKRVAFVGRLVEAKAPQRVVELARAMPELDFMIFGDGPLRAEIEQSRPSNLSLMGEQDMQVFWPQIDLLLMPSLREGLPMAALEAMSYGIPVCATPVGGLSHLVQDRHNGLSLQGEELEPWVEQLQWWARSDYQTRTKLAENARSTIVEQYSPCAVMPEVLSVYQTAMAAR